MNFFSPVLPSGVSVRFPTRRCNGHPSDTVPSYYISKTYIDSLNIPTIGASSNFGSQGNKWFHERAVALFNVSSVLPNNQATLDNLTKQIAIDFYSWNSTHFDEAFPQIIAPSACALTDTLEFTYSKGIASTRRFSSPYNESPEETMHHDPQITGCSADGSKTPYVELYVPQIPQGSTNCGTFNLARGLVGVLDGRLTLNYEFNDSLACLPLTCSGQICTTVTTCSGSIYVPGAIISGSPSGNPLVTGSCTTNATGYCCFDYNTRDTYIITAFGVCGNVTASVVTDCGQDSITVNLPSINLTVNIDSDCDPPNGNGSCGGYTWNITGTNYSQSIAGTCSPSFCPPTTGSYAFFSTGTDPCVNPVSQTINVTGCNNTINIISTSKTYNLSGNITGCPNYFGTGNLPTQGATVTVTGPAGGGSATSDSAGNYGPISLKANCSYTVTVSRTGFNSITYNLSPNMPCNDVTLNFNMTPDSNHYCLCNCPEPSSILTCPSVTDAQGTYTLYTGNSPYPCVGAGGSISSPPSWITPWQAPSPSITVNCTNNSGCFGGTYTGTTAYAYGIKCLTASGGGPGWQLLRYFITCDGTNPIAANVNAIPAPFGTPLCTPVPNTCVFPGACMNPVIQSSQAVTVLSAGNNCAPLSLTVNFTYPWSDTVTFNFS